MGEPTLEALQKENALLRQRVAALEEERNRAHALLQTSLDHVDAVIYLRDRDSRYTLVNAMQSGIEYALKARSNAQRGRREPPGAAK